jgi:hypothetical protein
LQEQFAQAFAGWDVDGDGVLNARELRGMLQEVLPPGTAGKEEARYCRVRRDEACYVDGSSPGILL